MKKLTLPKQKATNKQFSFHPDLQRPKKMTARLLKPNYLNLAVAALLCSTSLGVMAVADDAKTTLTKPYVTVNSMVQTNARAEILLREQQARGVADSQELRGAVRDMLVNMALMEQQARSAGLDKDILLQAQMELARQNILAQAWQQKVLSDVTFSEAELQAEYTLQVARLGDKEVLVRHLLVSDETTAKLLIEKLHSGSALSDLAKEYSRDTSTQSRGGLTDWTLPVNLLPEVAQAVVKLSQGKFTQQAVHSALGWHILQLEDARVFKAPSQEDLKGQLNQILARRVLEVRLKSLRDLAKVQ